MGAWVGGWSGLAGWLAGWLDVAGWLAEAGTASEVRHRIESSNGAETVPGNMFKMSSQNMPNRKQVSKPKGCRFTLVSTPVRGVTWYGITNGSIIRTPLEDRATQIVL